MKTIFAHMAAITPLHVSSFEPDDFGRSIVFRQEMSRMYIGRAVRWHLSFLLFGALLLALFSLIEFGVITTSGSSYRSHRILAFAGIFAVLYSAVAFVYINVIKDRKYEVVVGPLGDVSLNGKLLRNAVIKRAELQVMDVCRLGNGTRKVKSLLLVANSKSYVLITSDQESVIHDVESSLPVFVVGCSEAVSVYGVL